MRQIWCRHYLGTEGQKDNSNQNGNHHQATVRTQVVGGSSEFDKSLQEGEGGSDEMEGRKGY